MSTIKLRKGNRVVEASKVSIDGYLKRGYDQIDDKGNVVKHATGGKTISLSEYRNVEAKLSKVSKELSEAKKQIEALEDKAKEFAVRGKELQTENADLKKRLNNRNK